MDIRIRNLKERIEAIERAIGKLGWPSSDEKPPTALPDEMFEEMSDDRIVHETVDQPADLVEDEMTDTELADRKKAAKVIEDRREIAEERMAEEREAAEKADEERAEAKRAAIEREAAERESERASSDAPATVKPSPRKMPVADKPPATKRALDDKAQRDRNKPAHEAPKD